MNIVDWHGCYWCTPSAHRLPSGCSPLCAKQQTQLHCPTINRETVWVPFFLSSSTYTLSSTYNSHWNIYLLLSIFAATYSKRQFVHSIFDDECRGYNTLNTIHQQFSPYLYPFIIEFCILIVGIWYMIWANINKCPKKIAAHDKHDSESSMIVNGSSNGRDSATGSYDCAENSSGKSRKYCIWW